MRSVANRGRQQSARTHPGATSPLSNSLSSPLLFSSVNSFAALVDLENDSLGPVSTVECSSVPARSQKVHRLSSVSDDLGSVEHLIFAAVVQNSLAASAMTDSGATSDFINPAYVIKHKLSI